MDDQNKPVHLGLESSQFRQLFNLRSAATDSPSGARVPAVSVPHVSLSAALAENLMLYSQPRLRGSTNHLAWPLKSGEWSSRLR